MASPCPVTISIAMCTCMGQHHLQAQLQSIASQSRQPDELVMNDDASTDSTVAIIEAFSNQVKFPVRVERNPQRLGVTNNFARAISRCTQSVIVLSDQDDIWHVNKLARLAEIFERDASVSAVASDLNIVSPELKPTGQTQWQALGFDAAEQARLCSDDGLAVLLRRNVVTGAGFAFRAALRSHFEPIPSVFVHDEWIALIAAACGRIALIHEPLTDYRAHASQQIGAGPAGIVGQLAYARAKMGPAYFDVQVQRAQQLVERLIALGPAVRDAKFVEAANAKLAHQQRRAQLRAAFWRRLPGAMRELARGDYQRFGYGWKSFVQDILL